MIIGTILYDALCTGFPFRLRIILKRGATTDAFLAIHERTPLSSASSAKTMFERGERTILVTTERFLFFRRWKFKTVKNVVFLGPPKNPFVFLDLLTYIQDVKAEKCLMMIYWDTEFDVNEMERIIGGDKIGLAVENSQCNRLVGLTETVS